MIDRLIRQIQKKANPVCAGLDTRFEYVPDSMRPRQEGKSGLEYAAECILQYNKALMDAFSDIVPCVKVQSAYYEMYGPAGVRAFADTISYARKLGMLTIADVKRNDIGSTAQAYASAYIGRTELEDELFPAFDADFMTVNAYLGTDGVRPFTDSCAAYDKGIFVLVRTSNPSSGELQDLELADGRTVCQHMMDRVDAWGSGLLGENGFSDVGAVVGATYPAQASEFRQQHPYVFFLLPGAGAQGADISQLADCFDSHARGAIINNSRQVLTAWQKDGAEKDAPEAARAVLLSMKHKINSVFEERGIRYDREGAEYVGEE